MNLKQIIEGFRNDLLPPSELKDLIEIVSNNRFEICKNCIAYKETNIGVRCNSNIEVLPGVKGCGCFIKQKNKCLSCECPAKKWLAVTTFEKEQEISKKLKENGK